MYSRFGISLAIFITATVYWVKWVNELDSEIAMKRLIFASALTLVGFFFVSSKKAKGFLIEFEQRQEIETAKYDREREALKMAKINAANPQNTNAGGTDPESLAVTNPETAKSLHELEKLLYTRTITDAEFDLAKSQVFLSKSMQEQNAAVDRLKSLAALHAEGILSDVEYNAAKIKALGF